MVVSHRRMISTFSFILGALSIVDAFPVQATPARDNLVRTYPATMCQVWGPDVDSGNDKFAGYSQFGRLANKSTGQPLRVVCPIVRKENDSETGLVHVLVVYLDRHPVEDVSCTVHSVFSNGETVIVSETQTSTGSDALFQRFFFREIESSEPYDHQSLGGSMYTLFCSIPPKVGEDLFSWIGSYAVHEEPEDLP